jgi:hypothetical protein
LSDLKVIKDGGGGSIFIIKKYHLYKTSFCVFRVVAYSAEGMDVTFAKAMFRASQAHLKIFAARIRIALENFRTTRTSL